MKDRLTILIFFVLSVVPSLDSITRIAPARLSGVEDSKPRVSFSWETFWKEEWQHSFERFWNRRLGLRAVLVRTDNQLSLWLFGELGARSRVRVVLGKDDYLFEKSYVSAYLKSGAAPSMERIRSAVQKIKRAEELLWAKGKPMVLVISPSKAAIYPDKLPDKPKHPEMPLREYQAFITELKAQGVTFLDSHDWLLSHQLELGGPIFYRGGTHWSSDSSCRIMNETFAILEQKLGKQLRRAACAPARKRERPRGQDADLIRLANIWDTARFMDPYIYPAGPIDREKKFKPKIVFVGSSFLWEPMDFLRRFRMINRDSRLYYYFKTRAISLKNRLGPIDPEGSAWRDGVLNSDAVVVEINETIPTEAGFGFFDAVVKSFGP